MTDMAGQYAPIVRCSFCGRTLNIEWAYCPFCGESIWEKKDDSAALVAKLKELGEWKLFLSFLWYQIIDDDADVPWTFVRCADILTTPDLLADKIWEFLKEQDHDL